VDAVGPEVKGQKTEEYENQEQLDGLFVICRALRDGGCV
jgi:hypothetical protein